MNEKEMSEYEEEVQGIINRELLIRLLYLSVQFGLIWGTIRFIMIGNSLAGLTCFLGFLGLGVLIMSKLALNLLSRLNVLVEVGVKRSFFDKTLGRPNPGQIDRLLRCECDECQEMRDRFELPNRIDLNSLLTEMEEEDDAQMEKKLTEH
jgi:hypothetical protein